MLLAGPILTLALNTWILSKFSIFHWICLLFILLILVGVELSLCIKSLHFIFGRTSIEFRLLSFNKQLKHRKACIVQL